jgi:ribosomal protein S1
MSDEKDRPLDEDLEREIADALRGESLLGLGRKKNAPSERPQTGAFHDAEVQGVGGEDVFISFGPRDQGVVPADQFSAPPEVGERIRVYVERYDAKESIFLCGLKKALQSAAGWDSVEPGAVVNATVKAVNKGGLEVQVGFLSGFLPASHAALERVEDLSVLVDQTFPVEVIEADPDRRKLVVSRRAVLARQRDESRQDAVERIATGDVITGTVTRVERYGAFVDIGGVEGLVHVSQLDHKRVEDPNDVVAVGDVVKVQILDIEEDGKRIRLGMKQLKEDPWIRFTVEHPPGSVLEGKVTRLQSYGAFVEVADGVEGLAHISQLAPFNVTHPKEIVRQGDTISVRVVDVDPERRRIGLSLLTERGDRLTDDVADDATIREVLDRTREEEPEPTLGDLLKKALGGEGAS